MFVSSRTVMLALLLAAIAAPRARAENITLGGQPAELTVTIAGAHSVRVTLKPMGMALPPSPSLLNLEIKNPAISLRTIEKPVKARVGALDVEVTQSPLTVFVKSATGREIQKLIFDEKTGHISFSVGDAPVLGLGEGGQQPGKGKGPFGVQFDRRGKLDVMRPGWGSGTLGSRNPIAILVGTDGWGLFVASPWVQVDLRDPAKGVFIPTNDVRPTAGVDKADLKGDGKQQPAEARRQCRPSGRSVTCSPTANFATTNCPENAAPIASPSVGIGPAHSSYSSTMASIEATFGNRRARPTVRTPGSHQLPGAERSGVVAAPRTAQTDKSAAGRPPSRTRVAR